RSEFLGAFECRQGFFVVPFSLLQPRVGDQVTEVLWVRIPGCRKINFGERQVARKRAGLTFQEHDLTWCPGLRRHVFQYGERLLRFPDLQTHSRQQQGHTRLSRIRHVRLFQQGTSLGEFAVPQAKICQSDGQARIVGDGPHRPLCRLERSQVVPHFELCAQQVGPDVHPLGRRLRCFRKVGERLACPPLLQQRYPERVAGREKLAVPRQSG